jgi:quercetin dioxygenase-like cupin family protein
MVRQEAPVRLKRETLGSGVHDTGDWRRFSPQPGIVTGMYGGTDDIASVVVWCLEPGRENSTHRHPDPADFIVVLDGSGVCLRGEEGPPDPIRAGQVLIIRHGVIHGIRNTGNERLSNVSASTAGYKREAVGEQTGRWAERPEGGTGSS